MNFQTADLFRRIENLISIGTISQIDHARNLGRIKIGELSTDFLPLPASIGHNFIAASPAAIGTQVVLLSPSGDLAQGVIVSYIYSNELPNPVSNSETDLIQFKDGSKIAYNSATSTLDIIASDVLKINIAGNASLTVGGDINANIGGNANVNAAEINLNPSGQGVVTAECICAFTGSPHPDASLTVKASK